MIEDEKQSSSISTSSGLSAQGSRNSQHVHILSTDASLLGIVSAHRDFSSAACPTYIRLKVQQHLDLEVGPADRTMVHRSTTRPNGRTKMRQTPRPLPTPSREHDTDPSENGPVQDTGTTFTVSTLGSRGRKRGSHSGHSSLVVCIWSRNLPTLFVFHAPGWIPAGNSSLLTLSSVESFLAEIRMTSS